MNKVFVLFVFLMFSVSLSAEGRVPGTKVSLDPPEGFVAAKQFPGFMMESTGSSIMVTELPAPYSEISKGFTEKGFAGQGMSLMGRKDVKIASGDASLFHVSQSANGIRFLKWMLGFGNEKETVLVVATFPEQFESDLSAILKEAVLTTKWMADARVDQSEGLTFKVKEDSDLYIAGKVGNSLLLTRNGELPQKNVGEPKVVVGSSVTQGWEVPGDRGIYAKSRLNQTQILTAPKVIVEKEVEIDGLEGYLIEAEGKHKETGEMLFIMQCLLFTSDGYYIFQGMVDSSEKPKYQPVFGSILSSFSRI